MRIIIYLCKAGRKEIVSGIEHYNKRSGNHVCVKILIGDEESSQKINSTKKGENGSEPQMLKQQVFLFQYVVLYTDVCCETYGNKVL